MAQKHRAIAIDGPAGSGKTTLARILARKLGFIYVDTGALYRAFAVHKLWLAKEIREKEPETGPVTNEMALRTLDLEFQHDKNGEQITLIWGENVNPYLRTPEVSMEASNSSVDPAVRQALLILQQRQALVYDVVMEGRDIGTVILPDADVKIFLTASPEAWAQRRFDELVRLGGNPDFKTVLADQIKRDEQDSTRAACPLKQADDAVLLDTTNLDIDEMVQAALAIISKKLKEEQP